MFKTTTDDSGEFGTADTLYLACKAIVSKTGGNVIQDGRLIAFWDVGAQRVKPGFGATESERAQIEADAGLLTRAPWVDVDREQGPGGELRLSLIRVF